jgi:glycerol-3-phosphate dehydrogenase subunit B
LNDLLVVGEGLTGLFAAWLAAKRGAHTTLIAYGRGGLELSSGCLHLASGASPHAEIASARLPHPYALVGTDTVFRALEALTQLLEASGLPYSGSLDANLLLPTAAGATIAPAFAPHSLARSDLANHGPMTMAGLTGFRDFDAALASRRLATRLQRSIATVDLPLPGPAPRRDLYATDLARRFEDPDWCRETCRAWKPLLIGVRRLGLPAVLGLRHHARVLQAIEEALELTAFEIPTLPPCVPGLRLEMVLREACLDAGVDLIEGAKAIGRVDGTGLFARASGVVAMTAGGPQLHNAGAVLLATGDVLHGGIVAQQNGLIRESVFDLPVVHNADRATWTSPRAADPQPYASFGVRVDASMRPLDERGQPLLPNLYAAGGLLAGARRTEEGSRQGVALSTALRAVEAAIP